MKRKDEQIKRALGILFARDSIYKYFLFYLTVVAVAVGVVVVVIVKHLSRMDSSTDDQLNYDQYEHYKRPRPGYISGTQSDGIRLLPFTLN